MNSYKIEQFCSGSSDEHFITRFGGQPDWITTPQWPVSLAWNKRPLKFIGQVRLNDFFDDLESLTLVYIFMTQPEDKKDPFFDPDIIEPDAGETAVIVQPDGTIPEYIYVENLATGPTVDDDNIWIPQIKKIQQTQTTDYEQVDINKFCGIPAFFQNNLENIDGKLLLQLHTEWLPFYINAGGSPTMYVFLNEEKERGFILIEDL